MCDHKLRMEGPSKLKFSRKEPHDTGDPWPHLEFKRSNSCEGLGNFGSTELVCYTVTMDNWCIITTKLKVLGGCSSHHLQGVGAYCVVPTTGCTACFSCRSCRIYRRYSVIFFICIQLCECRIACFKLVWIVSYISCSSCFLIQKLFWNLKNLERLTLGVVSLFFVHSFATNWRKLKQVSSYSL